MKCGSRSALLIAALHGLLAGCGEEAARKAPQDKSTNATGEAFLRNAPANSSAEPLPEIPGFRAPEFSRRLEPLMAKADPQGDAWDTETFSAQATNQLKKLAETLQQHPAPESTQVAFCLAEKVAATPLRPDRLESAFEDGTVHVLRPEGAPSTRPEATQFGSSGLAEAFTALLEPFDGAENLRLYFKITGVERMESPHGSIATTILYSASGSRAPGQIIQQNATWRCNWLTDGAEPRLLAIHATSFEEVRPGSKGSLRFEDQTAALLGHDPAYRDQLFRGSGYWTRRLDRHLDIDSTGHQGIALGDANGDGLEDLYFCQQGGLPNRFYLQQSDGSLQERSNPAGVDWMENCHAALFADLDNDGDQDLAVAGSVAVLLHENDGTARFTVRLQLPAESNFYSISAADYDADGLLDLYFCGNTPRRRAGEGEGARSGPPMPYHDANNGGRNLLLRNEGSWTFRNTTRETGLDTNNSRFSFAAAWEDYDNDGDLDLYVANDFGRNNLYRNDGGTFTDVAPAAGVEDISAGMSAAWGDYDRDGLMDLYVSNMYSSAGNRVTYQRLFRDTKGDSLPLFQRHARGNSLFRNAGDGSFADVSIAANVNMGRWAWGARFLDFNNDGWEDLYVANGYITGEDDADL